MFKKLVIALFLIWSFVPQGISAQTTYTIQLHVYYTGTVLTLDPAYSKPYDIAVSSFAPISGNAYGEVFSFSGNKLGDFQFAVTEENPATAIAPFFNNAAKVILYGPTTTVAPLEINVGETATCNENSVCESGGGESTLTCPSDCVASTTKAAQANTTKPLIWFIIIGFFVTGMLGAGIFLYLRKRNNSNV